MNRLLERRGLLWVALFVALLSCVMAWAVVFWTTQEDALQMGGRPEEGSEPGGALASARHADDSPSNEEGTREDLADPSAAASPDPNLVQDGTHVYEGTITGSEGRVLAGASVFLVVAKNSEGGYGELPCAADSDGRYHFEAGSPDGNLVTPSPVGLRVSHEGYLTGRVSFGDSARDWLGVKSWEETSPHVVDVTLLPAKTVSVRLLWDTGEPCDGLQATLQQPHHRYWPPVPLLSAVSDEKGVLLFEGAAPQGIGQLEVSVDRWKSWWNTPIDFAGSRQDVVVPTPCELEVIVSNADELGEVRTYMSFEEARGRLPSGGTRFLDEGVCTFSGLQLGDTLELSLQLPDASVLELEPSTVLIESTEQTVTLRITDPQASIQQETKVEIHLISASGDPLENRDVDAIGLWEFHCEWSGPAGGGGMSVLPVERGGMPMPVDPRRSALRIPSAPPVELAFHGLGIDHRQVVTELQATVEIPVDLERLLADCAEVTFVGVGPDGKAIPVRRVVAVNRSTWQEHRGMYQGWTDPVTLSLAEGVYGYTAHADEVGPVEGVLHLIGGLDWIETVRFEKSGGLKGQVLSAGDLYEAMLTPLEARGVLLDRPRALEMSSRGRFSASGLQAGEYRISFRTHGPTGTRIHARSFPVSIRSGRVTDLGVLQSPTGTTVRLDIPPRSELATIRQAGIQLYAGTIASGDELVLVNTGPLDVELTFRKTDGALARVMTHFTLEEVQSGVLRVREAD